MARFVFELQAVLEQRCRTERDRQREVADLERRRLELEGRLRAVVRGMGQEQEELRRVLAGTAGGEKAGPVVRLDALGMAAVRRQAEASLRLVRAGDACGIELAGVRRQLDRARERLGEAVARRRAVELLRDRRYEEWKREQEKLEASEMDDLNNARTARRAKGGAEAA